MPAPCRSWPTPWIELASLFVDDSPLSADLHGLSAVTLQRRYELDTAVAVPVVVPVHKRHHPLAGFFPAGEWAAWVIRTVFGSPEQGFRVRVVVADARTGERPEHAQFFQATLQRGGAQLFEKPAARRCRYPRGGSAAVFFPC